MGLPEQSVVASGSLPSGETWKLITSAEGDNLFSFLRILRGRDTVFDCGMGGEPVPPGRHLRVCSGTESGMVGVIVRASTMTVDRVQLHGSSAPVDIELHTCPQAASVRLGAVLPTGGDSGHTLVALAPDGSAIETYPLPDLAARMRDTATGSMWQPRADS